MVFKIDFLTYAQMYVLCEKEKPKQAGAVLNQLDIS